MSVKGKNKSADVSLLDEILSLGGKKEDFALIEDLDEDEEYTGSASNDAKLDDEVRHFVKGLKFGKLARDAVSDDEPPTKKRKKENEEVGESAPIVAPSKGLKKAVVNGQSDQLRTLNQDGWLIVPTAPWYSLELSPLPATSSASSTLNAERKAKLRDRAEAVLRTIGQQYSVALGPDQPSNLPVPLSRSDRIFLSNVLSSGTSTDRLTALVLITSSSPLHSLNYLGQLLTLCSKKSRDEALKALQSVSEWLRGSEGGLPDRKLRWFDDRDEDLKRASAAQKDRKGDRLPGDEWLALWLFEDRLKQWYLDLIRLLETLSHDPLPFIRMRALSHAVALLSAKPEQEHNLLILASSLLADSDRSVASKASHLLLELLNDHSAMKAVVLREVASIVLRPVADVKAAHGRYYGLITMNQMILRQGEADVANKLLDVYFKVFADILTEQDAQLTGKGGKRLQQSQHDAEIESKLLAAVLTGVNRAFPYAELQNEAVQQRLDTLYRIAHSGSFAVSLQALTLVHRLSIASSPVKVPSDRFYRTLYESLIDSRLPHASKHAMYLNLVFRCMRADTSTARQLAFSKRLLQSLMQHSPPYVCGALRLLSELFAVKPSLRSALEQEEGDQAEERFEDAADQDEQGSHVSEEARFDQRPQNSVYDPRKRDPQYAGGDKSCLWELLPLLSHYHPSVRLFASELLFGSSSSNTSDMDVYALSVFLDRFAYREAKAQSKTPDSGSAFSRAKVSVKGAAVNTASFASKRADKVPADQIFFHRFFTAKTTSEDTDKRKRATSEDSDADEFSMVGSDEGAQSEMDEDEVWRAMKDSAQGAPGFDDLSDASGGARVGESDGDEGADYTSDEEDTALDALAGKASAVQEDEGASSGTEDEDLMADEAEDLLDSDEEVEVPRHAAKAAKKTKLKALPLFDDADAWASFVDAE